MRVIDGVEMIDVAEAAHIARRTPETVRRWVWSGRVAATKRGNRLLIKRADILAVLDHASSREAPSVTLTSWAGAVAAANPHGRQGRSASDLVLQDRSERDSPLG